MTVRRMKTYTGEQGYVYQYYFVGKRPAVESGTPATEYIFDVTSDRKVTYAVSVLVERRSSESLGQISRAHTYRCRGIRRRQDAAFPRIRRN